MKMTRIVVVAIALAACAFAQDSRKLPLQYNVKGNLLTPAAGSGFSIEIAEGFRYVGGQRFVLKQVADAEQHVFVEAGADGRVQRMVWVQFESFLPSNTHRYNYKLPDQVRLGDIDFISDAMVFRLYESDDPESDHSAMTRLLEARKLKLAGPTARRRMFRLSQPDRRRELMIIYAEAVKLEPAEIPDTGAPDERWPEIARSLREGAQRSIAVRDNAGR